MSCLRSNRVRSIAFLFFGFGLAVPARGQNCSQTSVGLIPLIDLGGGSYKGKQGGLYPKGSNTRPPEHEAAGLALARAVRPLNGTGDPDDVQGKIVFVSIGMSNTTQEFSTFIPIANADPDRNSKLVIVDGAVGGMTASRISNLATADAQQYWRTVDSRLAAAKVTPAQVQAAWIKEANAGPRDAFPTEELRLQAQLADIARILKARFPNIRLAYLSSRIYGGYASTTLNPEPFAYQSGFSVKWLIEEQINGSAALNFDPARGPVKAPWLSWGPYLWADGLKARSDGLTYVCSDLRADDGTHPAPGGAREKVANQLLAFLKRDSTARLWFLTADKRDGSSLLFPALVPREGNICGASGAMAAGIAVANLDARETALDFTALDCGGTPIAGENISNPRSIALAAGAQLPRMDHEIFGSGISTGSRSGWFRIDGSSGGLTGFFEIMDSSLSLADGVDVDGRLMSALVVPDLEAGGFAELHVANPNPVPVALTLELMQSDGAPRAAAAVRRVEAGGALAEPVANLFPSIQPSGSDYLRAYASQGIVGFVLLGKADRYVKILKGQDAGGGAATLYSPQYAAGGGWRSSLSVVNLDAAPGRATLSFFDREGRLAADPRTLDIPGSGKLQIDDQDFFAAGAPGPREGYVVIASDGPRLAGSVSYGDAEGARIASALPLVAELQSQVFFSQIASDANWYTGLAMMNPNAGTASAALEVFDAAGALLGRRDLVLGPGAALAQLLWQYVPNLEHAGISSGYMKLTSALPIASFAVYGSANALSAVPPQVLR